MMITLLSLELLMRLRRFNLVEMPKGNLFLASAANVSCYAFFSEI